MSQADNFLGKICNHKKLGRVEVIGKKEKSITVVLVEQIDKGEGFNDTYNRFTGVKMNLNNGKGWMRGQNYDYGKQDYVHIKELSYD